MATPAYFDEGQQYSDDDILAAIAQRESGGRADAWDLTNQYGMRGPWQFSPDTYASVAEQNGLDGSDWSPENQTAVARAHIHDLRSKYGLEGAIQAWLGGEGNIGNEDFTDGNGTSIREYTSDVMGNLMNMLGTNPNSISNNGSPYQTNLIGAYLKAGGKFDDPNEPLPMDFINRMVNQPTINPERRILNDYLDRQAPEITAAAMGAHNRNQNFFNLINKMSADATRTGAGIDNKNMQKTMAAQFADQIAQSNSTANIAILAKLGAALTGVQFDPNSKKLADIGAMVGKQMTLNNNAYKAMQDQANKDREFELAKAKLAIIQNNGGSYSKGKGGTASAGSIGSPLGYVVEDEDSIKNNVDKLVNSPEFKQAQNIIWNPSSTTEARNLATQSALKKIADYSMMMEQTGKRGTANELIDNIAASIISQSQEMSHPAGTNPADQDAQNNVNQGLLDTFTNTIVGTTADGKPVTLGDVQNSMNATENMVSQGQIVNRFF